MSGFSVTRVGQNLANNVFDRSGDYFIRMDKVVSWLDSWTWEVWKTWMSMKRVWRIVRKLLRRQAIQHSR